MEHEKWFALRVYYGGLKKVLRIKEIFDGDGIETFVPMRYADTINSEDPNEPSRVPALKDLVMIRATDGTLEAVKDRHRDKKELLHLDYYRHRGGEKKGRAIVIPLRQMQQFLDSVKANEDSVTYYTVDQLKQKKGRPVVVLAGQFKGVEGVLMRIEKNRHVVVMLPGVLGASLTHIPVTMLQFKNQ
jgi:transcription antitermination factor NusG